MPDSTGLHVRLLYMAEHFGSLQIQKPGHISGSVAELGVLPDFLLNTTAKGAWHQNEQDRQRP